MNNIRTMDPYGFRSGQWGHIEYITAADENGRRCYVVRFPDGVEDLWPVDSAAQYEFEEKGFPGPGRRAAFDYEGGAEIGYETADYDYDARIEHLLKPYVRFLSDGSSYHNCNQIPGPVLREIGRLRERKHAVLEPIPEPPKGTSAQTPAEGSNTGGSVGEDGPLVKVLRCNEDGVRVSALYLGSEGLFVRDDRGRRTLSATHDILDAISGSASLRDVRAEEATIFILGREAPAEEAVVRRLRLLDQDELAGEQSIDFFDTEGLPAPEAELVETLDPEMEHIEGVSSRGIVINGNRWVATCPQNGLAGHLWPQDPSSDDLRPQVLETWAHASFVERGSMTSGYDVFEIGLLSEDVVYLLEEPDDEEAPRLAVRGREPSRRREEEVVRWLLTPYGMLREYRDVFGIDLVALAVEMLIGSGQDQDAVPATILGGESDTLMCNLHLSGDREEFLAQIRRLGRGDAIDAVGKPRME